MPPRTAINNKQNQYAIFPKTSLRMDTYFILGTSGEQRMTTDVPRIRATVRVYEGRWMLGL